MNTSKSSYRDHKYSGSLKNWKRVRAQLKRFHDENEGRTDVWRKKRKIQETSDPSNKNKNSESVIKTYTKKVKYLPKSTEQQCPPITTNQKSRPGPLESLINRPCDPTLSSHQLTVEPSDTDVWQKKSKIETNKNENSENVIKTYTQNNKYLPESTEKHCPPITTNQKSRPRPLEPLIINWPCDPTLSSHQLTVEPSDPYDLSGLTGNRIVDIQHVIQWTITLERHRASCANSTIKFVNEIRNGFNSMMVFECTSCDKQFRQCNEKAEKLNKGFVWGVVTGGGYYTQAAHVTNVLDIPTMSSGKFRELEEELGDIWMDQLTEEIKKVGEQEKAMAIENGMISSDGIPYTEVYVDGGWAKRSYGHDYKSASGMACIIGKHTKKCLFLGIRNKYCFHCHIYNKEGKEVPPHQCFKNYEGPSTGMETSILVEGFQKSVEMHGMRYLFFVGDGDSSVYSQLREKVSYGQMIKKTECKNHVIKNYTSALYKQ